MNKYDNTSSGTNSQEEHRKYKELNKAEQQYNRWKGKEEIDNLRKLEQEYYNIVIDNLKNK
jgi:hypothetical protein